MTTEESANFYTEIPKSTATFALILYGLACSNKSKVVVHGEKIPFSPKPGTETNESVELNLCLLNG